MVSFSGFRSSSLFVPCAIHLVEPCLTLVDSSPEQVNPGKMPSLVLESILAGD